MPDADPTTGSMIACAASESFTAWLAQAGGSIVASTYQAGKLAMIGYDGRQVSLLLRQFTKPMGLAVADGRLALATKHEVLLFANASPLAHDYLDNQPGRYDALYLPRISYYTGDLNVHDLAYCGEELWLVNTRFCCLAVLSADFSFVPRWKPPFISEIVPEDRCHLNGLAVVDGKPAYVTALGETDEVGGWRSAKASGGIVIDMRTGEVLLRGLSMPHSPRWHQGRLWILNSGSGEILACHPASGEKTAVCGLPGYLRGLAFVGPYALVGMSRIREQHIFGGLPIAERHQELKCGIAVVDLRSGALVAMFEFTSGCTELYDVAFLPRLFRPTILNTEKEAVREAFTAPEFAYWLRPSARIP